MYRCVAPPPAAARRPHLDEQRDGLHVGDLPAVHRVAGHDVQSSGAALHDLLHPDAILTESAVRPGLSPAGRCSNQWPRDTASR